MLGTLEYDSLRDYNFVVADQTYYLHAANFTGDWDGLRRFDKIEFEPGPLVRNHLTAISARLIDDRSTGYITDYDSKTGYGFIDSSIFFPLTQFENNSRKRRENRVHPARGQRVSFMTKPTDGRPMAIDIRVAN